jgi:hypothetical protein
MISLGAAATIEAKLARPDLDLIKQEEQVLRDRRERFAGSRSGSGRATTAAEFLHTPFCGVISTFIGAVALHRTGVPQ